MARLFSYAKIALQLFLSSNCYIELFILCYIAVQFVLLLIENQVFKAVAALCVVYIMCNIVPQMNCVISTI